MNFVFFYHSLLSDWNHGNAHFLRGIATELLDRGHDVKVYEPANGWSLAHLRAEHGEAPLIAFARAYPQLSANLYERPDLEKILADADIVVVHEWNDPELVARIGTERQRSGRFTLFFHDTHHRSVTARQKMETYDLRYYDGVLAYGRSLTETYLKAGWTRRAWTWHEAADIRVFHPMPGAKTEDIIWIGNWGDDERAAELSEYLIEPVKKLGLRAVVHGVRYPGDVRTALANAGIEYRGWIANFDVPSALATARLTLHVPRRPYVQALPGIPTIRPFEAMACGIPLVSAFWDDAEGLFSAGRDYLVARNGEEMRKHLCTLLEDAGLAADLAAQGFETIRSRHTCAHRVDELLEIHAALAI
ncbi:MAG: glycosyltransferase [Verrucomicrobia bacterium]|nr:glycosyltransferase [Verrucomicrobiota bacterium]